MNAFPMVKTTELLGLALAYVVILSYFFIASRKSVRPIGFAVDEKGFFFQGRAGETHQLWDSMIAAHEGMFSYLVESNPNAFYVFPKRLLNEEENGWLQGIVKKFEVR